MNRLVTVFISQPDSTRKTVDTWTDYMGCGFAVGQGLVINDEAYVVTGVAEGKDTLDVEVTVQVPCDECGGSKQKTSNIPVCECDGPAKERPEDQEDREENGE